MELLLDHMLGKKVQSELHNQGHIVKRAIEVNLDKVVNGDLYENSILMNQILVTCDSDFDKLNVGKAMKTQ